MKPIYEFISYREYLRAWIEAQSGYGHGMKLKISKALGVSSSLVSQIISGSKGLTPDQASGLCDFFGLNEMEADFFHLLVDHDRAVTPKFREKIERKIKSLKGRSQTLGTRVPRTKELTDPQEAIYYSSWLYTGIRNLTAVAEVQRVDQIADRLKIENDVATRIVQFLLENGLCCEENGALTYGSAAIHVDKESPFVNKHHQNWRFQSIQKMERKRDQDVFFTGPMSLSLEAFQQIRALLPNVIEQVMKISGPSASETVACLNIDWFEY